MLGGLEADTRDAVEHGRDRRDRAAGADRGDAPIECFDVRAAPAARTARRSWTRARRPARSTASAIREPRVVWTYDHPFIGSPSVGAGTLHHARRGGHVPRARRRTAARRAPARAGTRPRTRRPRQSCRWCLRPARHGDLGRTARAGAPAPRRASRRRGPRRATRPRSMPIALASSALQNTTSGRSGSPAAADARRAASTRLSRDPSRR